MSLKGRPRTEPVMVRIDRMSCPEPNSGCVLWTGALSQGYARVGITSGRCEFVHRVLYEAKYGPTDRKIYHRCGFKGCVNVDHMTTEASVQRKPRHAKLDKEMADEVRRVCAIGVRQATAAKLLKVSATTINYVLDGRRYA